MKFANYRAQNNLDKEPSGRTVRKLKADEYPNAPKKCTSPNRDVERHQNGASFLIVSVKPISSRSSPTKLTPLFAFTLWISAWFLACPDSASLPQLVVIDDTILTTVHVSN